MDGSSMDVDVLIVGGGIQGLTLLHELTRAGATRALLASSGELGLGETLHSHGYMHRGYMMSAAGGDLERLVRELGEEAAWWADRVHAPYAPPPPVYYGLPADAAPERLRLWDSLGLPYAPAATPPALRGGDVDREDLRLYSIEDRLVSMRDLVSELAAPLQDRIVRAPLTTIELDESGTRVASCTLSSGDREITVRPRMLLLACGRNAQPLLRAARTPTGRRPLESAWDGLNRVRFVPMLLVRGEHLPVISGVFETVALAIFTHPVAGDESMWIVTFTQGHRTDRGDFDPSRERDRGSTVVSETVSRLCALVPDARERKEKDLEFSFYFGGKTDHPEGGNDRHVDDCGLANLRLAWPGVWSLSRVNAREIVSELRSSDELADILDPSRRPLELGKLGLQAGVAVGEERRLTAEQSWQGWAAFRADQDIR